MQIFIYRQIILLRKDKGQIELGVLVLMAIIMAQLIMQFGLEECGFTETQRQSVRERRGRES